MKNKSMNQLQHAKKDLNSGGFVMALDTGAIIGPEETAMLQALNSRSPKSVLTHLDDVAQRGPKKFLQTYFIGYGHVSIGDCGSLTVAIEGVSMLAAKAIQDSQLYNGQEVSTRYVDFATQPFIDPINTDKSKKIYSDLREFYLQAKPRIVGHLKVKYPQPENSNEAVYEKAINARAFDVVRGFLPAGASTNLSWHTTISHAGKHLLKLRHHPLKEVREIALKLEQVLEEALPSSFPQKHYPATEEYMERAMQKSYYFESCELKYKKNQLIARYNFDAETLKGYEELFKYRPQKTELPKWIADAGEAQFDGLIDFGSYRDLQRHRAVNQRMPILTTRYGFEDWYLDEMPADLAKEAERFLDKIKSQVYALEADKLTKQYYIPMGYLVAHRIGGNLPALVYLLELRSGSMVHPTLQRFARKIASRLEGYIKDKFDLGLNIHIDEEPTLFDVRRGTQDIVKKAH